MYFLFFPGGSYVPFGGLAVVSLSLSPFPAYHHRRNCEYHSCLRGRALAGQALIVLADIQRAVMHRQQPMVQIVVLSALPAVIPLLRLLDTRGSQRRQQAPAA